MDLDAFAAKHKRPGRPCAVCVLPQPLRDKINAALRAMSPGRPLLARWLTEDQGQQITVSMLNNHVDRGHVDG